MAKALTLQLTYLIEGTQELSYVSVPYISDGEPTEVDTLRKLIFENNGCKYFTPNYKGLSILKIDVDIDHPEKPFPLLRFNKEDEGVQDLSPMETIDEIWRKSEPPPARRIHIFVKFTRPNDLTILWNDQSLLHSGKFLTLPTVLPKVAASRILLEAAQLVYYEFWGKDVKDLLQDVPGHGNLQYLPQVQVDSLGLKHLFCPQVLLVCGEYKVVYEDLKPYGNDLEHRWGGVVVIGQPGIAKSGFLYYVLFCLLNEKKTVAFQVGGRFVLFQDTGVQLHDATDMEGYIIPDGTWALTDSRTSSEVPCQAFLTASRARNACIIQANATLQDYELWESPWRNECSVIMHKMPLEVMSSDELIALGTTLDPDPKPL